MADPTRARVLFALDMVEELCVGDLALALEASEDAEPSLHLGRQDHEPSAGLAQCLGRRRCDLRELFALGEEQWRERAALRGVLLVLQAAARVREVAAR